MDRPTCLTCPYWNNHDWRYGRNPEDRFDCQRNPPHLPTGSYIAADRAITDESVSPFDGVWPTTAGTDWCGQHPQFPAYLKTLE